MTVTAANTGICKNQDQLLMEALEVDKEELKSLKKKLSKIAPRPESSVEPYCAPLANQKPVLTNSSTTLFIPSQIEGINFAIACFSLRTPR